MAVGVLEDNVKIQKICNLHQIINKYMKKVPIFSYFLCKNSYFFFLFSGITNSYFPILFDYSYYLTPCKMSPEPIALNTSFTPSPMQKDEKNISSLVLVLVFRMNSNHVNATEYFPIVGETGKLL